MTIVLLVLTNSSNGHCSIEDTPYIKAITLYSAIAAGDDTSQQKWEQKIRSLLYTNLLAFRAFCTLPDMNRPEIQSTLLRLQKIKVSYDAAILIEYFCKQPEADTAMTWQLLVKLQDASFVTKSVLSSLTKVSLPSASLLFPVIDQVGQLEEAGKWAAKALFEVDQISYPALSTGLILIAALTDNQNWAAERLCQITGIDESVVLRAIREIHKLSFSDSWNSRSLFLNPQTTPKSTLFWLTEFFILPTKNQENFVLNLPKKKKAELLAAYADASEKLIWRTNNLHDVTDNLGREIGSGRLKKSSYTQLLHLFAQLDKKTQNLYHQKIDQAVSANDKGRAVEILRLATKRARKESALSLTSSNIYILLAQGNDLYDSSFRDIMVPVLRQRVAAAFQNDLLTFMVSTDPGNSYSSNFITNLAQKGKLTHFFPKELVKQKEIINLVADSAFHDQNSLILFSATFTRLVQLIDRQVRSHLIDIILKTINTDRSILSSQLQVILQHYIIEHRELLSAGDRIKISTMIQQRGKINIEPYKRTPFKEWLKDDILHSLSVFQRDDDGISSFFSYCRALIAKGYRPSLSKDYKLTQLNQEQQKELTALLKASKQQPKNNLSLLFRKSTKMPIVIDWRKRLGETEINHSVFVYKDKTMQQELIAQFLTSGHEMFAQRGHSYWRYEQLIAPFEALWKTGALNSAEIWKKQRFLSIGSCGGIKAYRKLNRLFRNRVDILATVGTGKSSINNPYNIALFETVATNSHKLTWNDVTEKTAPIFIKYEGGEYLQPGSLPAILHKMVYTDKEQYDTD